MIQVSKAMIRGIEKELNSEYTYGASGSGHGGDDWSQGTVKRMSISMEGCALNLKANVREMDNSGARLSLEEGQSYLVVVVVTVVVGVIVV